MKLKKEVGNGDKAHMALRLKGFVRVDKEKTEFDISMDLAVDQLDYRHLIDASINAVNGQVSNGTFSGVRKHKAAAHKR